MRTERPVEAEAVPSWPTARGRDPRERLTREHIVDAAMRLVDRDGLDGLSMRRLGVELDAGATSLYWHVRNKDELLDLLLDRVVGEIRTEVPDVAGWRPLLAETARATRRVLLRHRHLAPVMGERPTLGPNAVAALEWLLGGLRSDGFDLIDAALAAQTVINWASGFAIFECRDPMFGPGVTEADRLAAMERLAAMFSALPADRFPNVTAMAAATRELGADGQFEYGLALLLDGIEAKRLPAGA